MLPGCNRILSQPLPFIIILETGSSTLLLLAWNLKGMKFCFVVHHRYTKLSEAGQVTKNRSCRAVCARIPEDSPSQGLGRMVTGNWGRRGKGIKSVCLVDKFVSLQNDKNSGDRHRGDNLYNNVYIKLTIINSAIPILQ